jgi:hypothetical protein
VYIPDGGYAKIGLNNNSTERFGKLLLGLQLENEYAAAL